MTDELMDMPKMYLPGDPVKLPDSLTKGVDLSVVHRAKTPAVIKEFFSNTGGFYRDIQDDPSCKLRKPGLLCLTVDDDSYDKLNNCVIPVAYKTSAIVRSRKIDSLIVSSIENYELACFGIKPKMSFMIELDSLTGKTGSYLSDDGATTRLWLAKDWDDFVSSRKP